MPATGRARVLLLLAGSASLAIALLHVGIAMTGPPAYRWFGSGMELARMAEQGSPWPPAITLGVAAVFVGCALYPWSAAGLGPRMPWLRSGLVTITVVYLLRGAPLVRALMGRDIFPASHEARYVVFTVVAFAIGVLHLAAVWTAWRSLGRA